MLKKEEITESFLVWPQVVFTSIMEKLGNEALNKMMSIMEEALHLTRTNERPQTSLPVKAKFGMFIMLVCYLASHKKASHNQFLLTFCPTCWFVEQELLNTESQQDDDVTNTIVQVWISQNPAHFSVPLCCLQWLVFFKFFDENSRLHRQSNKSWKRRRLRLCYRSQLKTSTGTSREKSSTRVSSCFHAYTTNSHHFYHVFLIIMILWPFCQSSCRCTCWSHSAYSPGTRGGVTRLFMLCLHRVWEVLEDPRWPKGSQTCPHG